ncbi:ABC transporter ATP-binding protein [Gracilibacillus phocaeensis]|uniref:ABC transporter ATP-binding protein n=1 Tax=Gracilibacillus phocaeensis TaxID=2042304 RepID=UPI00102F76D8|nr:ABC transporter ATP-binding protein [Gracilibacillus phocaeensis]
MESVIQLHRISKVYRNVKAVDQVSLHIKKGEIYGFIGLNGAGKTTTIRMLLGMIRPTEGACYIHQKKVSLRHYPIWRSVGYLVETPHFYPELTVEENLHIYRRLRLISDSGAVEKVMQQLNLMQYADAKAKHLSLGNAQRLGIAKALLPVPDVLILDEPVNGLDPAGIVEVRELLQELAYHHGVTILISSHLLSEVAKIATKIGVLDKGKLVQEIDSSSLHRLLQQRLVIDTRDNDRAVTNLVAAQINEKGLIEVHDQQAIQTPDQIARLLVDKGIPPTRLSVEAEDLEAYFLRILRQEKEAIR